MSELYQVQIVETLKAIFTTLKEIQSKQDWFFDQSKDFNLTIDDLRDVHKLTRAFYESEDKHE